MSLPFKPRAEETGPSAHSRQFPQRSPAGPGPVLQTLKCVMPPLCRVVNTGKEKGLLGLLSKLKYELCNPQEALSLKCLWRIICEAQSLPWAWSKESTFSFLRHLRENLWGFPHCNLQMHLSRRCIINEETRRKRQSDFPEKSSQSSSFVLYHITLFVDLFTTNCFHEKHSICFLSTVLYSYYHYFYLTANNLKFLLVKGLPSKQQNLTGYHWT